MIDLEIGKWYSAASEKEWYNYFFRLKEKAVYLSVDPESEISIELIIEPISVFKDMIYDIFNWSQIDAKSMEIPEVKIFERISRNDKRMIVSNLF